MYIYEILLSFQDLIIKQTRTANRKLRALNLTGAGGAAVEKNILTDSERVFAEAINPGKEN